MHYIATAFGLLALAIVLIFSIQNLEAVTVSFLTWSIELSMIIVILGAYVLGMLTGWTAVHWIKRWLRPAKTEKK